MARLCEGRGTVAVSWHRGATVEAVDDPTVLGPIVADLMSRARRNAGMDGRGLD